MCRQLKEKGFLDENLLPTCSKQLPAMRNALLAISTKQKGLYPMRIKPDFWKFGYDTVPDRLYLTIIDLSEGLDRPYQPIGLITRAPLPYMPEFPIYLSNGLASQVMATPLESIILPTEEDLELFTKLTLQVFQDVFAKVRKVEGQMRYFHQTENTP
jgi:endoribonuclease Dicer